MNGQLDFNFGQPPQRRKVRRQPQEYKVVALRDCPSPDHLHLLDAPEKVEDYWRRHIAASPWFNPDVECCVVLLVTTRRRIKGHALVSTGTLDTAIVHAREVFRPAIVAAAAAVVLAHNHPSGDPTPSEADIKVTRDLFRAGQLLKIELLDSIVIGSPGKFSSLKAMGYFY